MVFTSYRVCVCYGCVFIPWADAITESPSFHCSNKWKIFVYLFIHSNGAIVAASKLNDVKVMASIALHIYITHHEHHHQSTAPTFPLLYLAFSLSHSPSCPTYFVEFIPFMIYIVKWQPMRMKSVCMRERERAGVVRETTKTKYIQQKTFVAILNKIAYNQQASTAAWICIECMNLSDSHSLPYIASSIWIWYLYVCIV